MAPTKFSAGERVRATRGGLGTPVGGMRILTVLPRDAGPQQYRVRAEGETFERVMDEGRLEAFTYE